MSININQAIEKLNELKEKLGGESQIVIEHSDRIQVSTIDYLVARNGRVIIKESK